VCTSLIFILSTVELAEPVQPVFKDQKALLRHLEQTDPESVGLARDFTGTAETLVEVLAKLERHVPSLLFISLHFLTHTSSKERPKSVLNPGLEHIYYRAYPK
jgi:hypothetical protein